MTAFDTVDGADQYRAMAEMQQLAEKYPGGYESFDNPALGCQGQCSDLDGIGKSRVEIYVGGRVLSSGV